MLLLYILSALLLTVFITPLLTEYLGRNAGWLLAVIYLGITVALAWPLLTNTPYESFSASWFPLWNISFELKADALSLFFAFLALVIGAIVLAYSTRYINLTDERGQYKKHTGFYVLIVGFTLSMVTLVLSDDLLLLFFSWELTSLFSFFLIARAGHAGEDGSVRTLLITFTGGLSLLAAISIIISVTGTTQLSGALQSDAWADHQGVLVIVSVLVAVAGFTKAAQFPFHPWLPAAMAAATPVSAYLHAATLVKAGIYLLLRFSPLFRDVQTWHVLLISVGLFSAVMAALFALQKTDLKKLMAYSTVSQLGWIVAMIGIGTPVAIIAAVLHTLAHAFFKSGLFMLVGVVDHAAGTRDIRRLPVLWRVMPATFIATLIGTASMAGIPPTLGFISKEEMLTALSESFGGLLTPIVLVIALIGATLTVAYCARIVFGGFLDGARSRGSEEKIHPVSKVIVYCAALPAVIGLPLAFVVSSLDGSIGKVAAAAYGTTSPQNATLPATESSNIFPSPHLSLWHGVTVPLVISLIAIIAGLLMTSQRQRINRALDRQLLPRDGVWFIQKLVGAAGKFGRRIGDISRSDSPTRHLGALLGVQFTLALIAMAVYLSGGWSLPARVPNQNRWVDVIVLIIVTVSVAGVCLSQSRIAAVILISAVGSGVTIQIFGLGAPDVGLTQLLVEILTVVVFMIALRRLPRVFYPPSKRRSRWAMIIGLAAGIVAFFAVITFTGRRGKSDLAEYFLTEGPIITTGKNVTNTIIVEFRAFDTFGELVVLGVTALAIAAILSSVPTHLRRTGVARARLALQSARGRAGNSRAYVGSQRLHRAYTKALEDAGAGPEISRNLPSGLSVNVRRQSREALAEDLAVRNTSTNSIALRLLLRFMLPVMFFLAAGVFWRGHNLPGGGFIAALLLACVLTLYYLAKPTEGPIYQARTPIIFVTLGISLAVLAGLHGYRAGSAGHPGGFLVPEHWLILGQHVPSALFFDGGILLAVIGLIIAALDYLGSGQTPYGTPHTKSGQPKLVYSKQPQGRLSSRKNARGSGKKTDASGKDPAELVSSNQSAAIPRTSEERSSTTETNTHRTQQKSPLPGTEEPQS